MIKDKLDNINRYKINEAFELFKKELKKLEDYLKIDTPFKAIPISYKTGDFDLSKFENHQKFIDIHYIVKGKEIIGLTPVEDLEPNMEYNPNNDYQLFNGEVNESILLEEGDFLLLFPGEAHVTGGANENEFKDVDKIVFKVLV